MTLIYDRSAELRDPPKTVAALSRGQKESAGGADNFAWTAPVQRCQIRGETWEGAHTCRAIDRAFPPKLTLNTDSLLVASSVDYVIMHAMGNSCSIQTDISNIVN